MPDVVVPDWRENPPAGFQFSTAGYEAFSVYCLTLRGANVHFGNRNPSGIGQASYADRLAALRLWLRENGLAANGIHRLRVTLQRRPYGPQVDDQWYVGTEENLRSVFGTLRRSLALDDPDFVTCPACGDLHPEHTYECPTTGDVLYCGSCGASNVVGYAEERAVSRYPHRTTTYYCAECGSRCEHSDGCENVIPDGRRRYCDAHAETLYCDGCENEVQVPHGSDRDDFVHTTPGCRVLCENCTDQVCGVCGELSEHDRVWNDVDEVYECTRCYRIRLASLSEDIDREVEDLLREMATIPGRESIRKCGIEVEGGNGTENGHTLARRLYNAGLSYSAEMGGYHSRESGFAHVERDSSVDWECVIGPFNPAYAEDTENLNTVVRTMREMVRDGELTLDMRAGLHVHVSAAHVGIPQAYNLSHVFTYLEDLLFRIGAARWPWHRSCNGNDACRSIPKHNRKTQFFSRRGGHGTDHDNHYYALSFTNYFASMLGNCSCGAVQNGFWDECECEDQNLGKCTFEFRVFNTTTNPRKIGAYLALCQALVAKALAMPEIKHPEDDFPGLPFNRLPFKRMEHDAQQRLAEAWKPRLRWLFTELPLTRDERAALYYCVRYSDLAQGLTEQELEELTTADETETEVVS